MKTPENRPRFQSSNRHYHRYRGENRDWKDWEEPETRPRPWKRTLWISTSVVLASAGLALLFVFDVL